MEMFPLLKLKFYLRTAGNSKNVQEFTKPRQLSADKSYTSLRNCEVLGKEYDKYEKTQG